MQSSCRDGAGTWQLNSTDNTIMDGRVSFMNDDGEFRGHTDGILFALNGAFAGGGVDYAIWSKNIDMAGRYSSLVPNWQPP